MRSIEQIKKKSEELKPTLKEAMDTFPTGKSLHQNNVLVSSVSK